MNHILPEAPKNVRGVIHGIEYPMRLRYVESRPEGHLWEACWPDGVEAPLWSDFDGLRVDMMPPRTGVSCEIRER